MSKVHAGAAAAAGVALALTLAHSLPARAQAALEPPDAGIEGLQEVVVSATKRNESVQEVGMSITAMPASELESKGVTQFFDYATSVPNLSFGVGAADGSLAGRGVYLRGIQGANTTGFYIDDTPVLETLDPHIVDVQRIEVLRGPQGTLYGAESMGGTVRIITAQPDATRYDGQTHVSFSDTEHGSLNELAEGDVNVPLISNVLALRASGYYQSDSGYFDRGIGPDESAPPTYVQHDVGGEKYYGSSIALRFQPIDGLVVTPRIMYQRTDENGAPYATYYPGNLLQREIYNLPEGGTDKWYLASLTVNYTLPWGSFVSSTGYFQRTTFENENDTDVATLDLGLTAPLPSPISRMIDFRRFAQEVRFASSFSGPFQVILGAFFNDSKRPRDYEWTAVGLDGPGQPPANLLSFIDRRGDREYAVFGNASYQILANLKATVGVRWFDDQATFNQYTNGLFFGGAPSVYVAPPTSERGFTPKYLVEYKVTPDVLWYASAAKGFREGGNNIALPPGPPPSGCDQDLVNAGLTAAGVATFKSDDLWDYESGFKTSLADHRFTLNATGFWIDWSKIQQLISLPLCGYGLTGNSGAARSTGAELEFQGRLLQSLTTGLSLGYEDARITKQGVGSPIPVGSPVQGVPGVTIAANVEYRRQLTTHWSGFARLDYSHVGESFSANNAQVNLLRRPAYNITDVRFGGQGAHYEVAAFVKNLTNEHANLGDAILIGAEIVGQPRFVINRPRTIGVEGRWYLN